MVIAMLVALAVQGTVACAADEASLHRKDQTLLDAIAPGNRKAWEQALTPDAVYVDENGAIMQRDAFLAALVPLPANVSGRLAITDYKVRFNGDTALVIHRDDERENYHGVALRADYLMTETWLCRDAQWKLAMVHAYVEAKDPPSVTVSARVLHDYEGRYSAAPDLSVNIRLIGNHLIMERTDRPPLPLVAETDSVMFIPGQPRDKRIFTRDANGKVTGFIDRREGEDIIWKRVS
jgi:hypothetical protein